MTNTSTKTPGRWRRQPKWVKVPVYVVVGIVALFVVIGVATSGNGNPRAAVAAASASAKPSYDCIAYTDPDAKISCQAGYSSAADAKQKAADLTATCRSTYTATVAQLKCASGDDAGAQKAEADAKAQAAADAAKKAFQDKLNAMSVAQQQAVSAAQNYLNMGSGFSRQGLIDQLSSSYGNGFSVPDATAAVDFLNPDWNAQAVLAAKSYLAMGGFSHASLVQQLSSSYGNKFTPDQAEYGATQVGL